MQTLRKSNFLFIAILLAYAVYAALYIYKTSFVVNGERFFMLFDDAMISMRYARNLAHGYGLVWNPGGERIEGYSNPLWVVFMALFHFFPFSASKISLAIQISGALFFIGSLYYVKKIAEEISNNSIVALLAVFLTAFYVQLSTWSLLGMEVSALLLLVCLTVWQAIRVLKTGEFNLWLYVLLGVGTLVRIDMAVPFLAILGFLFLFDAGNRRKHLLLGTSIFLAFTLGQTLLRLAYYGDVLPNTYYLKMTGASTALRIIRGLFVYVKVAWNFNIALFLLPFLVVFIRRDKGTLLMTAVFAAQSLYSIYVGGDAWEHRGGANRFVSIVMPLFFVLLAYSLEVIRQALVTYFGKTGAITRYASVAGLVAFAFVGLVNFNALLDTSSLKEWLLIDRHGFVPGSERYVRISAVVNEITTPEARIAVTTAGIIPYLTDRPSIDLMGKIDVKVAHEPMRLEENLALIDFRPGHMKWDSAYSLGELKPDVVVQLHGGYSSPDNLQYLTDYTKVTINDFPFFLKNGSPYVNWEQVDSLVETTP
ncbi:MAG: hypothetical protein EHM70_09130 [Chloroflexota bacterium]|nr:MAG: hypothetical protein EHM70_09130 [Chloroflexota bacterium]